MEKTRNHFLLIAGLLIVFSGITLAGPTYSFERITSNSTNTVGVGESQLAVEVIDAGSGLVTFLFTNTGVQASSITAIYFDNGTLSPTTTLQSIFSIDNSSSGVSFSEGSNPGNLPAGNEVGFSTTSGLSSDSDPAKQPNGVNPGEYVGLTLSLAASSSYDDVLSDLGSGELVVGLHVQGFGDGASESYITGGTPVPAPGAIVLASMGIGMVSLLRRRKTV